MKQGIRKAALGAIWVALGLTVSTVAPAVNIGYEAY